MSQRDYRKITSKVNEYIGKGRVDKAIEHLQISLEALNDQERLDNLARISARFNQIQDRIDNNEITQEQGDIEREQVKRAMQGIFRKKMDLDRGKRTTEDRFNKRIIQISSLLIILFLLVGSIVSAATQGFIPLLKAIEASGFVVAVSMVAFGLLYFVKKYLLV